MSTSRAATALHKALENHARTQRKLTAASMIGDGSDVLSALTGRPVTHDERLRLAPWVVQQLQRQIAQIADPADRRIAQMVLAATREFEDLNVEQRKQYVCDRRAELSRELYKKHRIGVLAELAAGLELAYLAISAPTVFVGGSYTDPGWHAIAEGVGRALAGKPVRLVAALCDPGIRVCYGLEKARIAGNSYVLPRTKLFGRPDSARRAEQPYGAREYLTGTRESVRTHLMAGSDLVLLFGGGPGTEAEARLAEQAGKPVVPLGFTRGTAGEYWRSHHDPVDPDSYQELGDPDPQTAVDAAVRLITRHLLPMG
ncbi:hypothetical protein [Nocardia aurantia]|uniref:Uncharacterized protein n=1 Tax=Nocardia aurantia TaxID=2585199 RepID=A0A7K0DUD5_9NOCA|nr:hypothetical protein [Nocardia aurantia]MQY29373.1 hypothetical protein [Nocardia aurantia]